MERRLFRMIFRNGGRLEKWCDGGESTYVLSWDFPPERLQIRLQNAFDRFKGRLVAWYECGNNALGLPAGFHPVVPF